MTKRIQGIGALRVALGVMATTAIGFSAGAALPGPGPSLVLTLKNHRFSPSTLTIPEGARVRFTLINRDAATEEFDSHDLRIEQVVTPMGKASFNVGPLRSGQYSFIGEFHTSTAQGKLVVIPAGR